jgi:hypothetical protein
MMRGRLESSAGIAGIDRHPGAFRSLALRGPSELSATRLPAADRPSASGGTPSPEAGGRTLKARGELDVGGQA